MKEIVSENTYPKGYCLLKSNKIEKNIYFIKKGIVRAYIDSLNNEITFWFGQEGDAVVSMKSYIANLHPISDLCAKKNELDCFNYSRII